MGAGMRNWFGIEEAAKMKSPYTAQPAQPLSEWPATGICSRSTAKPAKPFGMLSIRTQERGA